MKKVLPILLLLLIGGCAKDSGTEKHQGKRDNVVKVRDKVKEVTFGDLLIGRIARSYIFEDYLIITDYETPDELIHVFRKDDFSHVTSFAFRGQGPGEIANLGNCSVAIKYLRLVDWGRLLLQKLLLLKPFIRMLFLSLT